MVKKLKSKLKQIVFLSIPFIVLFLLSEIVIRLLNIPVIQDETYFFGFTGRPNYFQKSISADQNPMYVTNPEKQIENTSFPMNKSTNTFRVFALGGSATYGEPFGPSGAFSYWLKLRLSLLYPSKNVEMINCGRQGFGSFRVKNILDEIVNYDPDLIVVYSGNNEIRDYHFHRTEINIEINSATKIAKRYLDNSYIIRMIFHLFFKNHITSYGAETIQNIIRHETFNEHVFSNQVDYVNKRRKILDWKYGGDWVSQLDSVNLLHTDHLDSFKKKLIPTEIWPEKIKNIYRFSITQMIKKCKSKNIPIIFLTLSQNLFYNKDARLLLEKFSDAKFIIKDVCQNENVPIIETLPVLFHGGNSEIGFNMFMDIVHPTLAANQLFAKAIINKIQELKIIPETQNQSHPELAEKIELKEQTEANNFPFNSQYFSLIGWQRLICLRAAKNQVEEKTEIIAIAQKALQLDLNNEKAYLLLGALYSMLEEYDNAQKIWSKMKIQYGNLDPQD